MPLLKMKNNFTQPAIKELEVLTNRKTWTHDSLSSLPSTSKLIEMQFLHSIMDIETSEPTYKSLLVEQERWDQKRNDVVHNIKNIRISSLRINLFIASMFYFDLWTHDLT